jgi:regulatory protein
VPKPRPEGESEAEAAAAARKLALDLLARREHARAELARKLASRGFEATIVEPVLAELAQARLQSDERFAEQFVNARAGRGSGPFKIRMELRERGLDEGLAEAAIAQAECDWYDLAREVRRKRFGAEVPGEFKERARQARFLQARGFDMEQIRAAMGDFDD